MSLNSFLNNTEKSNNPKPTATRVIRRVVAPTPKEEFKVKRIDVTPNPAQTQSAKSEKASKPNSIDKDDDILTFSIVAKIYLPKETADRIDLLFMKMILGKISFQSLSASVSNLISKHDIILQLWNVILNRNINITDPLALKVKEIVRWFLNNDMLPIMCISFVKFIVESKQKGISKITLFSLVLNQDSVAYPTKLMKDLLRFSLELYPLIPSSSYHPYHIQPPYAPLPVTLGLRPFSHEFIIPKRIPDITTNSNNRKNYISNGTNSSISKSAQSQASGSNDGANDGSSSYLSNGNEKGSGSSNQNSNSTQSSSGTSHHRHSAPPPIKFTPSHNKNLINMPMNNGTSFIFNFLTKSTQVGHEGGSHPNPHYHVEAPPPTRDLHELLESMEVLEHAIDEIEGFDEDCQVYNYVIYGAGKYIYNQLWSEIERYLPSFNVRKFIIKQCRFFLQQISDDLLEAQHFSRSYLETQPNTGFLCRLNPPKLNSPFLINFKFYETNVSHYLKMLIISHPADKHKYTSLLWFVRKILPRFQIINLLQQQQQNMNQNQNSHQQMNQNLSTNYHDIYNTEIAIYGPKSLVCVLWYFSLLCETIEPIFASDPTLMGTWDAVLDLATDQIRNKFSIDGNKSNSSNLINSANPNFSNEKERFNASNLHQNAANKNNINNQVNQSYPKPQHLHQKGSKKQLTRILKNIIANRTIIDEMADEVSKHFGKLSQNIARFFPIFSRLNRAASWYRNDPHRKILTKRAEKFGHAQGPNAAQELAALRPLYRNLVTFPSNEKIYLLKFDFDKDKIKVIPQ